MNSPTAAIAWEIWRRGRRFAWYVLGSLGACALINLALIDRLHLTEGGIAQFNPLFGVMMVLSFLFLMGIFNYTEFNSTKEWNGFPYRLFALPMPTWQLVAVPMTLGVVSVVSIYFAWIKLVWTHITIPTPAWFGVVLGAYSIFYQATLWSLAGFRIVRLIALSLGGLSSIAVAFVPLFAKDIPSPWLTEKRLIPIAIAAALIAFAFTWSAIARQRCGGGRRRNWIHAIWSRILDRVPMRTRDFGSPAAAHFWFEWRRIGWLLPACTAFALLAFGCGSFMFRTDPRFTVDTLVKLAVMPIILAFALGKGFIKPEFWSTNLSLPTFVAVKPMSSGEFVVAKLKVAALSVIIAWTLVLAFVGLWLPLWADTKDLKQLMSEFRIFYPHSWQTIMVLYFVGYMVLTWRCLVSGLWSGLSGSRLYYVGSICLQVLVPALVLLAIGIWSDSIDEQIRIRPDKVNAIALCAIGWVLALAITIKLWLAAFSWNRITPGRTRQYLLIWSIATLCFVALGILSRPRPDVHRLEHLYVLAALLLFPLARLGLAPLSLGKNRHH